MDLNPDIGGDLAVQYETLMPEGGSQCLNWFKFRHTPGLSSTVRGTLLSHSSPIIFLPQRPCYSSLRVVELIIFCCATVLSHVQVYPLNIFSPEPNAGIRSRCVCVPLFITLNDVNGVSIMKCLPFPTRHVTLVYFLTVRVNISEHLRS